MNFVSKTNIFDFFGDVSGKTKATIFKKRWFDITTPVIAAALIPPRIKMIFRENPAKIAVWEKIR